MRLLLFFIIIFSPDLKIIIVCVILANMCVTTPENMKIFSNILGTVRVLAFRYDTFTLPY